MTRNEAREQLGLNLIDGADELYISANMFPLTDETVETPDNPVSDEDLEDYQDQENVEEDDKNIDKELINILKAIDDIDTTPTEAMATEAQRGLNWRREFKRGGTSIGVARANQLVNKENLSSDTVKRMYSYFSRHEVDKQGQGFKKGSEGYPSAGRIAWALWGGDAGFGWSRW